MNNQEVRSLLNDLFHDQALLIGGLQASDKMDENLIWILVQGMEDLRDESIKRIDQLTSSEYGREPMEEGGLCPHPAIEDFLAKIERDRLHQDSH